MTPEEVRDAMKKSAELGAISAAQIIMKDVHPDDQAKLSLAAKEVGGWRKMQENLHLFYEMLEDPKPEIMEGSNVRKGTASLCIAMVIKCRAQGLECRL